MPPIATEVRSDGNGAYRAHSGAEFLAYGCIPKPDTINLVYPGLSAVFCFLLGYYVLENRKDQQFGPCFKLSNRYQSTTRVLVITGKALTAKKEPIN